MRPLAHLCALAAAAIAAAATAGPAGADSIVYAKQGNLFLTSPDGSKGYQVTFDGGYSSPSQADDGIIGALRNKQLVRLDRRGRPLNAPINAMGSPGPAFSRLIGGPYEPRISPDGTRFAYYFYVQTSFDDYENDVRWIDTGSYGTWTYADHFTSPAGESEYYKSFEQAEWVTDDRLLATQAFAMNMWTWKLASGHGYTYNASQYWFGLRDPVDEWGVEAYHWYEDPALSRDATKLAMTDGGGDDSRLLIAATHGPAWSGEPPYPEPDYVGKTSDLAAPSLECQSATRAVANPSWSADADTLAYGSGDGVHVIAVPDSLDCSQMPDRLLVPGGSEPAFGVADVDMNDAPAPGSEPESNPSRKRLRISRLSLHPRAFRASRHGTGGTRVRYTLSAPARVTLTVQTRRGRPIKGVVTANGKAGANRLRFAGRLRKRALKPGGYRLRLTARPTAGGRSTAAGATFTVVN